MGTHRERRPSKRSSPPHGPHQACPCRRRRRQETRNGRLNCLSSQQGVAQRVGHVPHDTAAAGGTGYPFRMRLLLVEDDRMIGDSLRAALKLEGHAVDWVRDVRPALATLASERFDLVLLDLGLPPPPRRVPGPARRRPRGAGQPACAPGPDAGDRADRARRPGRPVAGLDGGADDYLVKPFEFDELNARIRAVLRRRGGSAEPVLRQPASRSTRRRARSRRTASPCCCRRASSRCWRASMARPGALLSRAQLEDRLYGWGEEIESNAVSVYIHQLRRKLGAEFIGTCAAWATSYGLRHRSRRHEFDSRPGVARTAGDARGDRAGAGR